MHLSMFSTKSGGGGGELGGQWGYPGDYNHDPVAIGKYLTNVLMYADDLVLMSTSKEGLQKCLDDLHIYCKNWKLTINTDKTKILP